MKKKQITYQAETKKFYRRLEKAWLDTQNNPASPDPMVKNIFKLVRTHASKKMTICANKIYTFGHKEFTDNTVIKQRYRVNGLGQLVLIPSDGFVWLNELPSYPMYI